MRRPASLIELRSVLEGIDSPVWTKLWPITSALTQNSEIAGSIRLFDRLMDRYNPSRPPAKPTSVHIRLSLSQIIEMDEITQVMSCAVWLRQTWRDPRLAWNPTDYGGVDVLHIPSEILWVPDIVLYNAEKTNNITVSTKVVLFHTGRIVWEPPALLRSTCQMDVEWFPFDEQDCSLKLDLQIIDNNGLMPANSNWTHLGIDLSDFHPSVEWDIMAAEASRDIRRYSGRNAKLDSFVDLTFTVTLRRKPLFYTVNLVLPNVFMAFLTPFVFYLPCESGEKVQLAISILVSVAFYFLLLTEIIPASGTSLPLIGKYLLFTMLMVSLSCALTVIVLDIYYRSPSTHTMSSRCRRLLLNWLPRLMDMGEHRTPAKKAATVQALVASAAKTKRRRRHSVSKFSKQLCRDLSKAEQDQRLTQLYYNKHVLKALENIGFISQLLRKKRCDQEVNEDWKFAAAVLDRFLLVLFEVLSVMGTIWVFSQTPLFYDGRQPLDMPQTVHSMKQLGRQF